MRLVNESGELVSVDLGTEDAIVFTLLTANEDTRHIEVVEPTEEHTVLLLLLLVGIEDVHVTAPRG